uniref:3-deoxy-manno-octulosonate cytidylyltransferase n=1 Tax=Rheinheimera sp. TaxID=1869214 RepID=UPI004047408D
MTGKSRKVVALLPSRLESSRLQRKALVDICGLPMIVHVYRRCKLARSLDEVFVATDSDEIRQVVESYGGKVVMTAKHHETGTDRIAEAAAPLDCDIVVNVQGDEVLVNPAHIDAVVNAVKDDPAINVGILVNPYSKRNSPSDIKAVINECNDVMYLSRNDIPSDARTPDAPMLKAYHIIPFRKEFLLKYASWDKGRLERIEFNEYLRILEKGYNIRAVQVESDAVSVDTVHDLEYVRNQMLNDPFFPHYK